MKRKILLTYLLVFMIHDLFAQCAMCKAVAEQAAEDETSRLNVGIIYIMIIPYLIMFIVFRKKIFYMLRQIRDAKGGK